MPDAPDITLDDLIDWLASEVADRVDCACEIDTAIDVVSTHLRTRAHCAYVDGFANADIGLGRVWDQ